MPDQSFPVIRPRRLRRTGALRAMVRENTVSLDDLIYPIFVEEELDRLTPVEAMPGVNRIPEALLDGHVREIAAAGVRAIMMFGVSRRKDASGSDSWRPDGLQSRMIGIAKNAAPDLIVMSDNCFCEYTDHGHCGVIEHGHVHNDHTLANLALQCVASARAGADVIAPSGMMDGQVTAIRAALDQAGFDHTPIMAYSSKFTTSFSSMALAWAANLIIAYSPLTW